jgi:hypothetical protein
MNDELCEFLSWEKTCRDTVDFKRIYVDMAGDLVAGLMLSQLVYWCLLPDEKGNSRLRVCRDGHKWVAKSRSAWWDEIRLSPKQADRAIKILVSAGLVVRKNSLFNGKRTTHLRIDWEAFRDTWLDYSLQAKPDTQRNDGDTGTDQQDTQVLTKDSHRCSPKSNIGIDQRSTAITETTTKLTTNNTTEAAAPIICSIHNVPMQLRTKNGDHWYSHRLADGTWCKGRSGDAPDTYGPKSPSTTCPRCWNPVYVNGTCEHGCWHCCTECWETNQEKTS